MLLSRVVIDSSARNAARYPSASDFEVDLTDMDLDGVSEVRLVHASVPFPEPHVTRGRDLLFIAGGNQAACRLTRGTYASTAQLCGELSQALRRDMGPGFSANQTSLGRVAIQSFTDFAVQTGVVRTGRDGFPTKEPLTGSAAAVPAAAVGNRFVAVAHHAPLANRDEVAVVRISNVCGVKSSQQHFDRSFAVLHSAGATDPLPNVHSSNPPCALRTLRVRLLRRDGQPFDTDGRDVTLHLDVVRRKGV